MQDDTAADPAEKIRFLHFTDIHAVAADSPHRGPRSDGLGRLRAALERMGALSPAPSFVVISGDLTDIGDPQSYAALKETLAAAPALPIFALGNHDKRAAFRASGLDPAAAEAEPDAPYDHDQLIAGAHVIVLDSSVPGQVGGGLDDAQLAFADAALGRHAGAPKLLVVHHPPAADSHPGPGWARLDAPSSAGLGEVLEGREVAAILSGHIHLDRVALWRGAPLITCTGFYSSIDPLGPPNALRVIDGASFGLSALTGGAVSTTFVALPSTGEELARVPLP